MEPKLILILILVISVSVTADYVRPKPRKALHFPWKPKTPSLPQQVTLSLISLQFLGYNLLIHDPSHNFPGKF